MEYNLGWIAASLSNDLRVGTAIPGRCEDADIALWRSESGVIHAWNDRCPHRGMRLSHGFVRGETLACIYHGWRYGSSGGCNHIPAHPELTPPKTITATTFACVESDGIIWVAADHPTDPPPVLQGTEPLRSMEFRATPEQIAAHLGTEPAQTVWVDDTALILQATALDRTNVHALCKQGIDRKAASRRLEALRREVEGSQE